MDLVTGAGKIELPNPCNECAITLLENENPAAAIGSIAAAYCLTYAKIVAKDEGRAFSPTDEEVSITYMTTPPGAEAALECAKNQFKGNCIVYRAVANRVKLEL